ncbi:hypothetical protein BC830DRAFT_846242 [Chytriomyces sp. MP71]|nr:hypothetical protein BC830DRAFT_846242 [Chytriomyces sp. MP71]
MQDKMEKADIVRDLVADRERDQIKIKKLTELTSHLMANNSLLQLCQSLNEGQSIPTSAITQVVHENIAIQLAIYDVISVMFNNVDSCRRVDKVIKSLSLNRLHTPATADEERAEKDFDDRFEALIDSLKKEGAGDRLLKAGALDSFHKHGGQSSAASSNDKK